MMFVNLNSLDSQDRTRNALVDLGILYTYHIPSFDILEYLNPSSVCVKFWDCCCFEDFDKMGPKISEK